ncbi:MAG: hypothetical protein CMM67_10580 [Rhodospirillaceae bacterium]|nr:hypothetical protein [Rhodospirillaceae bacterium]OUT76517.1 MAG: hypothetical protein CBB83_10760 [Rhodospirillaceae bacterium TMED23]|tara:strand:+ start:3931 stop:4662 length:732 start_codon:yes stop_codon:yes gene_type:complete
MNGNEKKTRGRPRGTGAQSIYVGLREDILQLRLKPGEHIEESILKDRFNLSRTPVREALIRLASEGLVNLHPNKGAHVSAIDISDIPQYFEALDVCQRMVLKLCAERCYDDQLKLLRRINEDFIAATDLRNIVKMGETNNEFHSVMIDACRNKYVGALYGKLLSTGLRLSLSAFGTGVSNSYYDDNYYSEVVNQHKEMITAISNKDIEMAEEVARKHTKLFHERFMASINKDPKTSINLVKTF